MSSTRFEPGGATYGVSSREIGVSSCPAKPGNQMLRPFRGGLADDPAFGEDCISVLNAYFERIICLTTRRRTDRWNRIEAQAHRLGFTVEKVVSDDLSAELDDPVTRRERITHLCRWFGLPSLISCSYGHRHIWEDIRRSGARSALILEDDALFAEGYTNERFAEIWQQVPADWQMLYLGHYDVREIGRMLRRRREVVSPNLVRPSFPTLAHAYAITGDQAGRLLRELPRIRWYVDYQMAMDVTARENIYAFEPSLVVQPDHGDSDQSVSRRNVTMMRALRTAEMEHVYSLNLCQIFGYVVTTGGVVFTLAAFLVGLVLPGHVPVFATLSALIYLPDLLRNRAAPAHSVLDVIAASVAYAAGGLLRGLL